MNVPAGRRLTITEECRIALPRHVKLRYDETRKRWVILVPERVLVPDETAVEVIQLCDGTRTVGEVVDVLAEKYVAERSVISQDVVAMLQDLADKDFLAEIKEGT
jgi:pyrroloquinoline quinone biosynthesis protein D